MVLSLEMLISSPVVCNPVTSRCLPVDEGLISIYLQRAYVTLLQHPFLNNIEKVRVCREFFFRFVTNTKFVG